MRRLDNPKRIDYQFDYRRHVGEEPADYFRLHDKEQPDRLAFLYENNIQLRGKRVLDVGCGAGSFLDHIEGVAHTLNGVEPDALYQGQNRIIYPNIGMAYVGFYDIATSFLVIEHVDNPVGFLTDIRSRLNSDGVAVISTPNANDPIIHFEKGRRFFYRTQHPWYFTEQSLRFAAQRAGFTSIDISRRRERVSYLGWDDDDDILPQLKMGDYDGAGGMYLYMVAK